MYFTKKSRHKPLFKQIIKLRGNIQNKKKLLNFKKFKWKNTIQFYKKKIKKYRNYQKFKPLDQTRYAITRFANRGTGYKKGYRAKFQAERSFRLIYGGMSEGSFKNQREKVSQHSPNARLELLKLFETRLDTVLYRAKFSNSVRGAGQLINHGKVYVNNSKIKSKSYQIKIGDLINLNPKFYKNYRICVADSLKWPLPPRHLLVNFRTMQILFVKNIRPTTLYTLFLYNLRLRKILTDYL